MSLKLFQLSTDSVDFPPLNYALEEPNGLLAVGGDLSPPRLISAYKQGVFPWYSENDPLLWWSPDPRAIILLEELKINRTLNKFLKKMPFTVTINQAFSQVINYCSDAPFRKEDTWIVPEMQQAYQALHQLGYAHSIEVWDQQKLVGGLYGVAINGFFSGESMFYKKSNASKVALVYLAQHLKNQGINFIDCQLLNPFLKSMGAIEITRDHFILQKNEALDILLDEEVWQPQILNFVALAS